GSVMDYPHPLIQLREDRIDLSTPYGVGVGPWDHFAIKHAYQIFPAASEAAELQALRTHIRALGFDYVGDADARAPGDAHAAGLLWDNDADVIAGYRKLLAIRTLALANFGYGVLPPDRQNGELEARLVPLYLLHRYQAEGVARLIGGVYYRYGLADETFGTQLVEATRQQQALEALLEALSVENLAIPDRVLGLLSPQANEYRKTPEYFAGRAGPVFDPGAAVESATALVASFLFDPARLNRLHWQHQRQVAVPGVNELVEQSLQASWLHRSSSADQAAVAWARNWVLLDGLIAALEGGQLQPAVAAIVRQQLAELQQHAGRQRRGGQAEQYRQAADYIARYLADPNSVKIRPMPVPPPGAPI
ncbi:MAG: zinc-dependent metalloprotease, partial [Xanthomonadales bacterium]|nr:zinc-dependent metalloprotease [Xanthomonadales bacterium]